MKRLILHAGTHKTGTSSIQHVLQENRGWLSDRGFTYATFDDCKVSHNRFAHRLADADEESLPVLRDELLGNVENDRALVVSAEEFSARIIGGQHWHHFDRPDYWSRKRAYLARLRELVQDFDEVNVLLCFRRQDQFAESLYATNLRSDRFRWSFEEFRERCAPIFGYHAQLLAFRNIFDNVRVTTFERLEPNLVTAFLEWAGIPVPPADATRRHKVTPDLRLIHWLYVRGADDDPETHRLRAKFCRAADIGGFFRGAKRPTFWRSIEERLRFLRLCTDPEGVTFADPELSTLVDAFLDAPTLQRVDNAFQEWRDAVAQRHRDRPRQMV
jgi:hypothetical protein